LASIESKQGQLVNISGGNFALWPVNGVGAALTREFGHEYRSALRGTPRSFPPYFFYQKMDGSGRFLCRVIVHYELQSENKGSVMLVLQ
jgi:hypothetical protein